MQLAWIMMVVNEGLIDFTPTKDDKLGSDFEAVYNEGDHNDPTNHNG